MPKRTFTKEDIRKFAEEENVRYLRLQFTDILGTIKNVEVPVSQLEKVLDNEMMFDGSSIEGFVRIEESDMYLHPDLDTWVIFPWTAGQGKVARLICDVYKTDGTPFEGDPRANLKRVLKENGRFRLHRLNLGPEPEFFLFKLDEKGEPTLELNDDGGYFDLAPTDLGENCRRDIVFIRGYGLPILKLVTMKLPLVNMKLTLNMQMLLQHVIISKHLNWLLKQSHVNIIYHATFMPKPLFGVNGSGMHFNVSLFKGKENAFFDPNTEMGLTETAYQFTAGVLKNARGFTAVCNPLVNSYKRLVPGYEAPCYIAWSGKNH